jgi:transposase
MAAISKTELIKLQKTLKTDALIGKKFGISRQAVHQLRQKYGIDYVKTKNKERNDQIIALYKKDVPGAKIAKQMKVSISQVYRIIGIGKKPAKAAKPAKKGKKK